MRYRAGDVVGHCERLGEWWLDLPMRRRWWWRELLLEPGAGWLRWKPEWRERIYYEPPDIDQWQVFPPMHRAWLAVIGFVLHPLFVLRGDCKWNEWPSLMDVSVLKDKERRLWR